MVPLEPDEVPEIYQDENRLDTSMYYRQFSQNRCDVRALNSVFSYQNEYLGNRYPFSFDVLDLLSANIINFFGIKSSIIYFNSKFQPNQFSSRGVKEYQTYDGVAR